MYRGEKMKIDRLIGIIMTLLQQEKVTAPELAKQFEVSRRTINRDIEDICKAGIPLVTTQGRGGGISIAENYKIEKTFFAPEELQTIFAGLRGVDSVSKIPYFSQIVKKLSSRENPLTPDGMILIDLASHYQEALSEKIAVIRQAVEAKHTISFHYYSAKGETYRLIEPYHLVFQWSSWYVFGYCLDRNSFRMFKLNRLWELHIQENVFSPRQIPEERLQFDSYFQPVFHLKAVFSPNQKYRLIDEYGVDCFQAGPDGRLLLERNFVSYENMREWIFSFGDQVEILEPEELFRDRLAQAENILRQAAQT